MQSYRLIRPSVMVLLAAASLAACGDQPLAPAPRAPAAASGQTLAELTCTADARAETFSCATLAAGPTADLVTFGGQNRYVRLTSSATSFSAVTGELSTQVSLQNLLTVAVATADGTTPDPQGVRVFFPAPPTNGVTVANATGVDVFTDVGQAYFEYDDDLLDEVKTTELGGNGILSPGETSANKPWRFQLNGAASFTFKVYVQTQVPNGATAMVKLTSVVMGTVHACGLTAAGAAYCWGHGQYGEIGDGSQNSRYVPTPVSAPNGVTFASISNGTGHTCALTPAGVAYCWGNNQFNGLGDSTTNTRTVPTLVKGSLVFSQIRAGEYASCGVSGGQVFCWGFNPWGQVGDNSVIQRKTPVLATHPAGVTFTQVVMGSQHTCALTAAGQVYCWGENTQGQVGDGTRVQRHLPTLAYQSGGRTYTKLAAASYRTCGLTPAGQIFCWGYPNDGVHVANDTALAAPNPANLVFTQLTVGHSYACGLTAAGKAFCWGGNANGAMGNGGASGSVSPGAVVQSAGLAFTSFSSSTYSTCALTASDGAFCWGDNIQAQLGDGTGTNRLAPVSVAGTF